MRHQHNQTLNITARKSLKCAFSLDCVDYIFLLLDQRSHSSPFLFQCPGGTFTPNMKSTKDYPDEVINFMRNHPAMYNAVYPIHKRPLVVRTNVDYEFTTITVDQVAAADGNYEVLFLGTGECFVIRPESNLCLYNYLSFVFFTQRQSAPFDHGHYGE